MKEIILDIKDMSDSKEVYGSRPNPFVSLFIYTILGLFIAAIFYSFFGEIEEVSEAFMVVRPNEAIGKVASRNSGKIKKVYFSDGMEVKKGDKLFSLDDRELKLELSNIEEKRKILKNELKLNKKFIKGITKGENPFSNRINSEEYSYYIDYKDYELAVANAKKTREGELQKTNVSIKLAGKEIANLEKKLEKLKKYKESITSGKNKLDGSEEYSNQFKAYLTNKDRLKKDYEINRETVKSDNKLERIEYHLTYFKEQAKEYRSLISAIEEGEVPEDEDSLSGLLYKDYLLKLAEFERNGKIEEVTYQYNKTGGNIGDKTEDILRSLNATLKSYLLLKEAIIAEKDFKKAEKDLVKDAFFISLYHKYKDEHSRLNRIAIKKVREYADFSKHSKLTNTFDLFEEMNESIEKRDRFKDDTLAEVDSKILEIKSEIAMKEVSLGLNNMTYNTKISEIKLSSKKEAASAYQISFLSECKKKLGDYENKITEYKLEKSSIKDKEEILSDLKDNYKNAEKKGKYEILIGIAELEKNYKKELDAAKANFETYSVLRNVANSDLDKDGELISVSRYSVENIAKFLAFNKGIKKQISDLDEEIKRMKEKRSLFDIRAEKDGIINFRMEITEGDLLNSGQIVANIIPKNEGEYKTELYIKNSDIASIKEGSEIHYHLEALPGEKFGLIEGRVLKIAKDSIVREGEYIGFYKAEGNIDVDKMFDETGKRGKVTAGMQGVAKVVKDSKKIYRYVLEKLAIF